MGKLFNRFVRFIISKKQGSNLAQELNEGGEGGKMAVEAIVPLARQAAAEGIILLKNNGVLPIKESDTVAVFGRCAIDYFAVGYGSGGDVRKPYTVNLVEGLKNSGVRLDEELLDIYSGWSQKPKNIPDEGFWGNWPMSFPEMPLDIQAIEKAAEKSSIALVVIGRAAGEDRENKLEKGSYYLTDDEVKMLNLVSGAFKRVAVVMDCGNIIDMAWTIDYEDSIGAIVYAWQGGMESGNAVADVLTGKVNPSGRLPDTIAIEYDKFPSAQNFGNREFNNYGEDIYVGYRYFETFDKDSVLYPFGYGLSYSSFETDVSCSVEGTAVTVSAAVKNTGSCSGKETVQVYVEMPQGALGKAARVLAAFAKSGEIAPGETETVEISLDLARLASYDDCGASGNKSCFVLEAGEYRIYSGGDSRGAEEVFSFIIDELIVVEKLREHMAVRPEAAFKRLVNRNGKKSYENVPTATINLKDEILADMPKAIEYSGDKGLKLKDVEARNCSLDEFIAQLSPEELDDISHGEGKMDSPLGTAGNAGAFCGSSEALREKGIPPVITVDGPAGIRLRRICALLPCGTALASSFNTPLVAELYALIGEEMVYHKADVLLAPGMNIHRDPLCGRNFEYFSEDPLLSGKMGAAVVLGLQSAGVSACPKHFACNNQETNRNYNDSRLSERALREIYLKGFEIAVKESKPHTIMTSYNKINSVWSHYNYELVTSVLRGEWGFGGIIVTDWWMRRAVSPEFEKLEDDAYRVRAQVDVLMPGGDGMGKDGKVGRRLLDSYGDDDGIQLGEMQRVARNVLKFAVNTKMKRESFEE